jgi:hypothetical protein
VFKHIRLPGMYASEEWNISKKKQASSTLYLNKISMERLWQLSSFMSIGFTDTHEETSQSCFKIDSTDLTLASPRVWAGQRHTAACAVGMHSALWPHATGFSQGFLQRLSTHAAVDGQSESVKQSPGFLQPVFTGSPTRLSGHWHVKLPGEFLQL